MNGKKSPDDKEPGSIMSDSVEAHKAAKQKLSAEALKEYNRVIWHSRRGMLELDLVLEPFVKQAYLLLDEETQAEYRELLNCQDQELFDWFLKKAKPSSDRFQVMVDKVLAFQASRDLSQLVE